MITIQNDKVIQNFYRYMIKLKTYNPTFRINTQFEQLVNHCIKVGKENDNILITNEIHEINKICGEGEFELEKHWAEKIISTDNPQEQLKKFPYYENYHDLIKLELLNIKFFVSSPQKALFIGGGPLPLSSIILAQEYNISSTIVDISNEAVESSIGLIKSLNLESSITVKKGDISSYKDNQLYDFVAVASLVFLNENQNEILQNIEKNIDFKLLLTRSSDGIRQVLYKKIQKEYLQRFFDIQLEVHPKNHLINSIFLSTKKPK